MAENEKLDREELLKNLQTELDKLTVKDMMANMASNLASLGFKHLGLPPEENEKFKDLNQAQLAIEGLASLLSPLEEELAAEESDILKTALSNLRMLYVKEQEKEKETNGFDKDS